MRESRARRGRRRRGLVDQRMHLATEQVGFPLVAEHGQRRAVDEGAAALGVDAVQAFGGGVEQALQRLASAPHLVLGRGLDPRAVAHEGQPVEAEQEREDEVQAEQQALAEPCTVGELGGERDVSGVSGLLRRRAWSAARTSGAAWSPAWIARVGPVGQHPHLLDHGVALGPGDDRLGHQRRPVEPAEQPDAARDVALVGAALAQALPRRRQVGSGLLQGLAGDAIADAGRPARPGSADSPPRGGTRRSRSGGAARPSGPSSRGSRR